MIPRQPLRRATSLKQRNLFKGRAMSVPSYFAPSSGALELRPGLSPPYSHSLSLPGHQPCRSSGKQKSILQSAPRGRSTQQPWPSTRPQSQTHHHADGSATPMPPPTTSRLSPLHLHPGKLPSPLNASENPHSQSSGSRYSTYLTTNGIPSTPSSPAHSGGRARLSPLPTTARIA